MANYSIDFKLLLPRAKLLRIDVLPFLFLYAILGTALYHYYDDAIYNLYLRLTIIATLFLQSTLLSIQVSHTSSVIGLRSRSPSSSTVPFRALWDRTWTMPATCSSGSSAREKRPFMASVISTSRSWRTVNRCTSSTSSRGNFTSISIQTSSPGSSPSYRAIKFRISSANQPKGKMSRNSTIITSWRSQLGPLRVFFVTKSSTLSLSSRSFRSSCG